MRGPTEAGHQGARGDALESARGKGHGNGVPAGTHRVNALMRGPTKAGHQGPRMGALESASGKGHGGGVPAGTHRANA